MFEFDESGLPGCLEIRPRCFEDHRGRFIKTFRADLFADRGLNVTWPEQYYSVSTRGVLRGLHFQLPPHDHAKLVYCSQGQVLDAVVDLRRGSPGFGRAVTFELSAERGNMVYLPRGMAHGFYTLSEIATLHYLVETIYTPEADAGILWSSADIAWPSREPILSDRDLGFPPLREFRSPFHYRGGADG